MKEKESPGEHYGERIPNQERAIFEDCLEMTPAQRTEHIRKACAGDLDLQERIRRLLAAHDSADKSPVVPLVFPGTEDPRQVGPYKILKRLGEGGMGIVYLAEQTQPIRRRVALKLIKLGMDTKEVIGRFESERQALALMNHHNIARILDAGATKKGRPYFVMEFVPGISIVEYCNQNRLSIDDRLALFSQACLAIEHAHQNGVIHRDIKSSNILVTEDGGVPVSKVIDFGIAKATEQHLTERTIYTQFGSFMGTPDYASPEQADLTLIDVNERSDVYSLGVVLYELLVGETPFCFTDVKGGYEEFLRMIREDEPDRPSIRIRKLVKSAARAEVRSTTSQSLARKVSGELDWITLKAIAKEPRRRYESAQSLADDVSRYLNHEPVRAGPPSILYRLQKAIVRNRQVLGFLAIVLLLLVALVGMAILNRPPGFRSDFDPKSIAVLPLENSGSGTSEDYFSDGLTAEIIAHLSKISGLTVISRTSSMKFKGTEKTLRQIGEELQVALVIEGSVRRQDSRVRINVQLIDARTDRHLWADSYDRDLTNIFEVQSEISEQIASALQIQLSPIERKRVAVSPTESGEAYDLFLRGRYFRFQETVDGLQRARDYFEEAVQIDPDFSTAWAELSGTYLLLGMYESEPFDEMNSRAREVAERALEIRDDVAEAHVSLAILHQFVDWDWIAAEQALERAIELDPGNMNAHREYGWFLSRMERIEEALSEMEKARALDPLSVLATEGVNVAYFYGRDWAQVLTHIPKWLEKNPGMVHPHYMLALAYDETGQPDRAAQTLRNAIESVGRYDLYVSALSYVLAKGGRAEEARRLLQELLDSREAKGVPATAIARAYIGLGETERAFEWLDKAFDSRDWRLMDLKTEPVWDSLRSDSRFVTLLKRLGFES